MAAAAPDDSDWKQECTCVVLVGAGLLMVRLVLERVALPPLRRWSKARLAGVSGADPSTAAFKMFDDLYHTCVSTCFAVWCWTMLLTTETECTPWDTAHCLRGWPNHPKSTALLVYYAAYASVYVSELLGTLVGAGCMLTKNMVAHHMISLLLMSIGHWSGWHRIGGWQGVAGGGCRVAAGRLGGRQQAASEPSMVWGWPLVVHTPMSWAAAAGTASVAGWQLAAGACCMVAFKPWKRTLACGPGTSAAAQHGCGAVVQPAQRCRRWLAQVTSS